MDHTLVDCEVCDRSHRPNHPHIANIDGDIPIDEPEPIEDSQPKPLTPVEREVPDWLRDQPGVQTVHPERKQALCEVCGIIKRVNHRCKGVATEPKPCRYCQRAGEPCVRHGGERSSVRTAKRHDEKLSAEASEPVWADERIAQELPKPVPVVQPAAEIVVTSSETLDRELAAMDAILKALEGLTSSQVRRMLAYIADRAGAEERR